MAEVPSRGATGRDPKGIYNPRQGRAVADTSRSGQYRAAPVRQHSIDEIGYIPYGNVYERQGEHPTERAPSGGLYERPVNVVVNSS